MAREEIEISEQVRQKIIDGYELAQRHGATVEVIGAWVWAWFDAIPTAEARQELKDSGFRWNMKRKCWQLAGVPCRSKKNKPAGWLKAQWAFLEPEGLTAA